MGGVIVRNTYAFDTPQQTSFWFVIKDKLEDISSLPTKVRNQVRKSFKTYDFRRVSGRTLLESDAYKIYLLANDNYRIKSSVMSAMDFEADVLDACDKKEYWVAYTKEGQIPVAYAINYITDECCEYRSLKANPEYLNSTYPYYGLIFMMNQHYLGERHLKYVNDGARSISNHSNIQSFLISKFLFRKAYCQMQIEYKWWLKGIVNILFPFRKMIKNQKITMLLNQESIRRGLL